MAQFPALKALVLITLLPGQSGKQDLIAFALPRRFIRGKKHASKDIAYGNIHTVRSICPARGAQHRK